MLVNREFAKIGDKVSGYRIAYDEEVLIEGTVTKVDRFGTRDGDTLTNVDVKTDEGYEDWFGWDNRSKIIKPIDNGKVEDGWCNLCHSYCWGDCEANGLRAKPERITFAPYHKGDTGSVYTLSANDEG